MSDQLKKVKPESHDGDMIKANEKFYPTVQFDFQTLPEAKKWEVGKTYRIELDIKQTSLHENKHGGGAGFEIRGIKVLKAGKKVPRYK